MRLHRFGAPSAVAIGICLLAGTQAKAVTLDMSSGVYSQSLGFDFSRYDEQGFTFLTPQVAQQHFDSTTCVGQLCWHEGPVNTVNQSITMTFGGGSFNLLSTGIGFPNFGTQADITVSSDLGHLLTFSPGVGNQVFNWLGVTTVTWDLVGGAGTVNAVYLDNLQAEAAAVPEPGTLALLGLGLAGLRARRRRTS
jgi:hypothetical protein